MINLIECKEYKIFIISDTHGFHRKVKIPQCDIIILCGDICNNGNIEEIIDFFLGFLISKLSTKIFCSWKSRFTI